MAVQNDNTILNKGDLKAYHQKILPFLGGNYMMSTNNSDYYSTDEKVVGVWTDGRPIYQKTFTGTTDATGNADYNDNTNRVTINVGASVNEYVSAEGFIVSPFGTCYLFNYFTSSDDSKGDNSKGDNSKEWTKLWLRNNDHSSPNTFVIVTGTSINVIDRPFTVTIQYTKTTDTAGSATTIPGAYDINFPNTWPTNKEIFFGNGMYGYRATGSTAITSGTVKSWNAVSITRTANTKIYNYGGTWKRSAAIPAAADTAFGMALSEDPNINTGVMIGSQAIIFTVKDAFTGTATYDFFVTYTK